jgi:hypothetical protein
MKNKLQIVQNKVVRFILGLHHRKSITINIEFEKLGFLNISNRVKRFSIKYFLTLVLNLFLLLQFLTDSGNEFQSLIPL